MKGGVLRTILRAWLQRVPVPASFTALAARADSVCIVAQSDSVAIGALLDAFSAKAGFTAPSSYASDAPPAERHLTWVSLHDRQALEALLRKNPEQEFATLNIFARRGPIKSNPRYEISWLQLLEILLGARILVISFGTPHRMFEPPQAVTERLVRRAQRKLKLDFFRNLKVVRGIPFQPIAIQERLVLSGADFDREVGLLAAKQKVPRSRILKQASKEFRTIAANPIRPMYSIGSRVCRLIVGRLFGEVTTQGMDQFIAAARQNAVVLVPMHRSHFDYLLVGQKLYESNTIPPVVAAGVNLSFWPIGFVIRSLGAYFVKRNARQDRLHALILRRYVTYLVKRGHLQEFFIEGGRSRSGRMRSPKLGLLSVMVDAYLKGLRRDIMFVPVSITYENVVEDQAFGAENTGQVKRKENLFELLRARSIFRKRYGGVVISFGTPISLMRQAAKRFGSNPPRAGDSRAITKELAHLLTVRIRSQTSVSLTSLAYTALLAAPRYGLSRADLTLGIKNLALLAARARTLDAELGAFTPTLRSFLEGGNGLLDDLPRGGIIMRSAVLHEDAFYIPGKHRFTADFYKNTVFHLFFVPSLLGVLHCMHGSFTVDDGMPLYRILAENLLLRPEERFKREMSDWLRVLTAEGITAEISPGLFTFRKTEPGVFVPNLVASAAESAVWCFQVLLAVAAETGSEAKDGLSYDEVLKRAQDEYRAAQYLDLTERTEASSQSSLQAALDILADCGIISIQDGSVQRITVLHKHPEEIALLERVIRAVRAFRPSATEQSAPVAAENVA